MILVGVNMLAGEEAGTVPVPVGVVPLILVGVNVLAVPLRLPSLPVRDVVEVVPLAEGTEVVSYTGTDTGVLADIVPVDAGVVSFAPVGVNVLYVPLRGSSVPLRDVEDEIVPFVDGTGVLADAGTDAGVEGGLVPVERGVVPLIIVGENVLSVPLRLPSLPVRDVEDEVVPFSERDGVVW